jgi:uncharacterized protein YcbX
MIGEELNATEMNEKGVLGDRAFGLWDVESGLLANARNIGRWPDMFSYRSRFIEEPRPRASLPSVAITLPSGDVVYSSSVEAPRRLSRVFGRAVALRRLREGAFEGQPTESWSQPTDVHIITTSSLRTLQAAEPSTRLESRRFRPNLVVESWGEGFAEDDWVGKEIVVGEVILRITRLAKRCVLTTYSQGDLPQELEILQAICRQNDGNFGVYAQVVKAGHIRRGEDVYIV